MIDHYCYAFYTPWSVTWYCWHELTAEVNKLFGNPGLRYVIDADEHSTTYKFSSASDALLFKIKFFEDIQ